MPGISRSWLARAPLEELLAKPRFRSPWQRDSSKELENNLWWCCSYSTHLSAALVLLDSINTWQIDLLKGLRGFQYGFCCFLILPVSQMNSLLQVTCLHCVEQACLLWNLESLLKITHAQFCLPGSASLLLFHAEQEACHFLLGKTETSYCGGEEQLLTGRRERVSELRKAVIELCFVIKKGG